MQRRVSFHDVKAKYTVQSDTLEAPGVSAMMVQTAIMCNVSLLIMPLTNTLRKDLKLNSSRTKSNVSCIYSAFQKLRWVG